ncbi:MAG: glycosyltransferase family 2 protein [Gemmataceae bacterium]
MAVSISVIVPTYKRPALLSRCLAALARQNYEPSNYEVIIADNAADPETRSVIDQWAAQVNLCVRYLPAAQTPGPAAARNAAAREARGKIFAFTDDDCVPELGWLRAGEAALSMGAAAAAGSVRVPLPEAPTDYERNEAGLERAEFVTANCFCRRAAFNAIGGFDERFTMAWREDSDLFFSLLERGYQVIPAPAAVVLHPVRPGHWGISLKLQRKSMFNALLYRKHAGLYRQRVQPHPPWLYYGIAASVLTAFVAAAVRQPAVAGAAGSLWLFLTARFCVQRLRQTTRRPGHVLEMIVTSSLVPLLSVYWRLRGALRYRVLFL